MLSLTPLLAGGMLYSALPDTFTKMGSPTPPDFKFKRIGGPPIEIDTIFVDYGDETLSPWKKEVPRGVAKAAA